METMPLELNPYAKKYPQINRFRWFKLGQWKGPVLRQQFYFRGSLNKYFKAFTGLNYGYKCTININPHDFQVKESFDEMLNALEESILKDPGFLIMLSEKLIDNLDKYKTITEDIKKVGLERINNEELYTFFSRFVEAYCNLIPYSSIWLDKIDLTQRVITKLFEDKEKLTIANQYLGDVDSLEDSFNKKANDFLLKIKKSIENNNDPTKLIRQYQDEFGWLHIRHWIGEIPTEEEIKEIALSRKVRKEVSNTIQADLTLFSDYELSILDGLKRQVFLKTYRKEMMCKSDFYIRPLLNEIAERMGLDYKELAYCTIEEIEGFFKVKKVPRKTLIRDRFESYALCLIDGKIFLDKVRKSEEESALSSVNKVKGMVAFPGKVKGVVKIVNYYSEQYKISEGDILVSDMTTPDLIKAMNLAAGFITDRGSALCHASVIARELKKPCIIGTGNATEVFKDGDEIVLDAEKGIAYKCAGD